VSGATISPGVGIAVSLAIFMLARTQA
jgi:hypothetical protein